MPQFYARYVPPTSDSPPINPPEATSEKRKRKAEREPRPKNKKQRVNGLQKEARQGYQDSESAQDGPSEQVSPATKEQEKSLSFHEGANNLSKYSVSPTAVVGKNDLGVHQKAATNNNGANGLREQDGSSTDADPTPKKKKAKQKDSRQEDDDNVSDDSQKRKHSSVLSKFDKAKARMLSAEQPSSEAAGRTERPEMHGLEPIPQPELVVPPNEKLLYSTLAAWQANAVKVVHGSSRKFSEFSISDSVVSNLKKHGLEESLSVQTTVLPLLLDGPDNHDGDVCVSAATGSGKTLAYIVPMIEALKEYQVTSLRGVIIVPTRELVQQVRQLCEVCAAGTSLKVATAAGNRSLKEEQKLLVTEEEVYDPKEYQRQQNGPIDWSTFSLEKVMRDGQKINGIESVHFVKQFKSNVDILITTPGRLVDHLRSTEGFNLDHVRWLVVDEADRLLNESYQEWVDIVTPALQSQAATSTRDKVLGYMRMKVPQRVVRKVLLSATMTRDISKLNSLGLQKPKLVILGSAGLDQTVDDGATVNETAEDPQPDRDGAFHLPPSLSEYAITIKDGHDKPLFLLQLLERRILGQVAAPKSQKTPAASSDTDSSPSDDSDTSLSSSSSDTNSDTTSSASSDSSLPISHSFITNPSQASRTPIPKILIFTRSTSSATRLSRLLTLLSPTLHLSTLTRSTSTHSTSRRALKSFLSSKTSILIATDRASRGLDIPHLTHVVSYDVPGSALTYVHRVGRTARAGRGGDAWTLVEYREGKWFWGEIGGKGQKGEEKIMRGGRVRRVEIALEGVWGGDEGRKRYEDALGRLGDEVRGKA